MIVIFRSKYKICFNLVYITLCLFIAFLFYYEECNNDEVAYAMIDDENIISTKVSTLGSADKIDYSFVNSSENDEQYNETYIPAYSEQCMEYNAVSAMKVYEPELYVNGLKTVFREKIKLSKKDKNIMYRIVEAEAGGEDLSGRMLVANVIINRMKSGYYPKSVKGVVFAHSGNVYQFSPISDGRYYTVNVSDTTKRAVNKALQGEDNSSGAEYFICRPLADKDNTRWFDTSLNYLFKYGCHEFFSR